MGYRHPRGPSFPDKPRRLTPGLPQLGTPGTSHWLMAAVPPFDSFHPCLNIQIEVGRVAWGCLNDVLVAWTDLTALPPLVLSNPSGNQTASH